ncbi:helix-turn-helix protein [compost metagenome]
MIEDKKGLPGLKGIRDHHGMSQSALARALGVPERQVQRWEAGESSPSVWAALAAARVLCCTVEDLAGVTPGVAS